MVTQLKRSWRCILYQIRMNCSMYEIEIGAAGFSDVYEGSFMPFCGDCMQMGLLM